MEAGNSIVAVALALLVHALLAAAIVLYVEYAPEPTVSAELDLSSVELSFAEEKAETAQVAPAFSSAPRHEARPPKPPERPPEIRPARRLQPEPAAYRFPEPKEERPRPIATTRDIRRSDVESEVPEARLQASSLAQARVDAPPKPKRAIKPEYPKGARQRGEQGDVVLEIEVGADGSCAAADVVASSGFAELDAAAVAAVRKARFVPGRSGSAAVSSSVGLKLSFRLK